MRVPQEVWVLRPPLLSARRQEEDGTSPAARQLGTGIHLAETQGEKHGSKTKFGTEIPCGLCRTRAHVQFSHSPPRPTQVLHRLSPAGMVAGAWPRCTQAGNLPPESREKKARNQKLYQGKHPTGTDGDATRNQGLLWALVCSAASPAQPSPPHCSPVHASHLSPCPFSLEGKVKGADSSTFPASASGQEPPESLQRAKQKEASFSLPQHQLPASHGAPHPTPGLIQSTRCLWLREWTVICILKESWTKGPIQVYFYTGKFRSQLTSNFRPKTPCSCGQRLGLRGVVWGQFCCCQSEESTMWKSQFGNFPSSH